MFVATGALILPAAFDAALPDNNQTQSGVLALSRGTSIILLILYTLFLVFQLKTHASVFNSEAAGSETTQEGEQKIVVSTPFATTTLLIVTVAVSFCSDFLVGSIDDVVEDFGISKTFIGLILVPVVGNAGMILSRQSLTASCNRHMRQPGIQTQHESSCVTYIGIMHANRLIPDPFSRHCGLVHGRPNDIELAFIISL